MPTSNLKTRIEQLVHLTIALLFGYLFWYIFSASQMHYKQLNIPICFYEVPDHCTIDAPETILIHISAKRSALRAVAVDNIALHLNATQLKPGPNQIKISPNNLFLPNTINLINCQPSYIVVVIKSIKKEVGNVHTTHA